MNKRWIFLLILNSIFNVGQSQNFEFLTELYNKLIRNDNVTLEDFSSLSRVVNSNLTKKECLFLWKIIFKIKNPSFQIDIINKYKTSCLNHILKQVHFSLDDDLSSVRDVIVNNILFLVTDFQSRTFFIEDQLKRFSKGVLLLLSSSMDPISLNRYLAQLFIVFFELNIEFIEEPLMLIFRLTNFLYASGKNCSLKSDFKHLLSFLLALNQELEELFVSYKKQYFAYQDFGVGGSSYVTIKMIEKCQKKLNKTKDLVTTSSLDGASSFGIASRSSFMNANGLLNPNDDRPRPFRVLRHSNSTFSPFGPTGSGYFPGAISADSIDIGPCDAASYSSDIAPPRLACDLSASSCCSLGDHERVPIALTDDSEIAPPRLACDLGPLSCRNLRDLESVSSGEE